MKTIIVGGTFGENQKESSIINKLSKIVKHKINNKNYIEGKYYRCNKNLYMNTKKREIAFVKGKKYLFKRENKERIIFIDERDSEHTIYAFTDNDFSWIKYFSDDRILKLKRINGSN